MMKIRQPNLEDEDQSNDRHIPDLLIFEILSRVSVIKCFLDCRLVCKSWAEIISEPDFATLNLSRTPASACLLKTKNMNTFQMVFHDSYVDTLFTVPYIRLPSSSVTLTNTCNGLLCLIHPGISRCSYEICVLNPLLRKEYISIPISSYEHGVNSFCVIGFCHLTNQYKILLCSYSKAEIYTLGQGLWRNVLVSDPAYIKRSCNSSYKWRYCLRGFHDAFIDGALHWTADGPSGHFICCFDFVAEQFRWVPHPRELTGIDKSFSKLHLGAIKGNLSILDYSKCDLLDIWMMSEYGVEESWSKHIVIHTDIICKSCIPIMVTSVGKVLLASNDRRRMMLYNPNTQASECEIENSEVSSAEYLQTVAYTPTLISLKDVAKGENITVISTYDVALKITGSSCRVEKVMRKWNPFG